MKLTPQDVIDRVRHVLINDPSATSASVGALLHIIEGELRAADESLIDRRLKSGKYVKWLDSERVPVVGELAGDFGARALMPGKWALEKRDSGKRVGLFETKRLAIHVGQTLTVIWETEPRTRVRLWVEDVIENQRYLTYMYGGPNVQS